MLLAPRRRYPLFRPRKAAIASMVSLLRERKSFAYLKRISPALVRARLRFVLSINFTWKNFSRSTICLLTVGWVRESSSAALVKLLSSMILTKVSRWWIFILEILPSNCQKGQGRGAKARGTQTRHSGSAEEMDRVPHPDGSTCRCTGLSPLPCKGCVGRKDITWEQSPPYWTFLAALQYLSKK